jgi:hypothetical protein
MEPTDDPWDGFMPVFDYAPKLLLRAPVPDVLDLPPDRRILRDVATGRPIGGYTRTGIYLTRVK